MKLLISILFFFSFSLCEIFAQCPDGDVTFIYQQDVDHFIVAYPDCAQINGSLSIGELNNYNTSISDISALNNITSITGQLNICHTQLSNLQGLQNLSNVNGKLFIYENNQLNSLGQLSNLTETGGVEVFLNQNLESLNGIENIETSYGNVRIGYNPSLQNISLSSLNSVFGYFDIIGNTALTSLEGLNNLTYIGSLFNISSNNLLTTLEGLESLTTIEGSKFDINNNNQLTSLQGIENLNLESLSDSGFGLLVNSNASLTTCNLQNVCNYLSLDSENNPREITGNMGNCLNEQAVLAACNLSVSDVERSNEWQVFYQKQTNSLFIQTEDFSLQGIQIYNLEGQLIADKNMKSSDSEKIQINSIHSVVLVKVISTEGKVFSKKVMIK